jgi:hypothetical protein
MFATAALVDMKFKDDRRKQWDLAIAEAKASSNVARSDNFSSSLESAACEAESDHLKPQSLIQNMALSILGVHEQTSILRSPAVSVWDQLISTHLPRRQDTPLEAQLKILDSHVRESFTGGKHLTAEEGSVAVEMDETDLNGTPRRRRKLRDREPQDRVHLEHIQQMVMNLVTRFLLGKEPFLTQSAKTLRPALDLKPQAKIMADQLALLKTGTIWRPTYSLLYDKVVEERKSLNESITAILTTEASNLANIDLMVAKICYNLLISAAPPSINTYNIMLIHFTRLQQHHLAQAVVDSFFEDSRFRPTSSTVAAILDHYASIRDMSGFASVIQRMRGTDSDMRIRREHFSGLVDPKVQSWAQQWNVIHRNGFLIAKMPRNALVFKSLILGSLRVFGIRRAVIFFKAALREGCHVTVDLFIRIAQVCLNKHNKEAAAALLSAIISRWHQCKGSWRLMCHTSSREIILQMMDLCGVEHLINGGNHRLPHGLRNIDLHVFKAWLRAVHLEVLNENITRSSEMTSGLKIMLATSSSRAFSNERIFLGMLELIERHPLGVPRRQLGPLVAATQFVTDGFYHSYKDMEATFFDIVYAGLSAESREIYNGIWKRSPNMKMNLRLDIVLNLRQRRQGIAERNSLILSSSVSPSEAKVRDFAWRPSVAAYFAGSERSLLESSTRG